MSKLSNRSFSLIPLKNGSFDPVPAEMLPDGIPGVPDLIGSLMFSVTYAHLYHICTAEYPAHIALQEYYEAMPDLVDALAEAVISNNNELEFRCIVYPKESESASDYFGVLLELVLNVQEITSQSDQLYQPQLDAIKEQVESTLYKLKRLSGGQKVFSEKVRTFSKKYKVFYLKVYGEKPKSFTKSDIRSVTVEAPSYEEASNLGREKAEKRMEEGYWAFVGDWSIVELNAPKFREYCERAKDSLIWEWDHSGD